MMPCKNKKTTHIIMGLIVMYTFDFKSGASDLSMRLEYLMLAVSIQSVLDEDVRREVQVHLYTNDETVERLITKDF